MDSEKFTRGLEGKEFITACMEWEKYVMKYTDTTLVSTKPCGCCKTHVVDSRLYDGADNNYYLCRTHKQLLKEKQQEQEKLRAEIENLDEEIHALYRI